MVRVGVETGTGRAHAADPVHRRDSAPRAARGGDAASHFRARVGRVNRPVGRVEELADVHRRARRAKPARLVRLVPDEPLVDPAVVGRRRTSELGERCRTRCEIRRPAAVRPPRRSDEADDGRDAPVVQAVQDEIALLPVLRAAHRLDPVPVEVEADDLDARGSPAGRGDHQGCRRRGSSQESSWIPKRTPLEACAGTTTTPNRAHEARATRRTRIEGGFPPPSHPTHQDLVNVARRRRLRAFTSGT